MPHPAEPDDNWSNSFEIPPQLLAQFAELLTTGSPAVQQRFTEQLAVAVATSGRGEPNVDPVDRLRLEELGHIAALHVGSITNVTPPNSSFRAVNSAQWATESVPAYGPLFDRLSAALSKSVQLEFDQFGQLDESDIEALRDQLPPGVEINPEIFAQIAGMMSQLGPALPRLFHAVLVAHTVGHLATRVIGQYDVPLTRVGNEDVLIIEPNLDRFVAEWELPRDDVTLWICARELAQLTLARRSSLSAALDLEIAAHLDAYPDHIDLSNLVEGDGTEHMGSFEPDSFANLLGDPRSLLAALHTPEQDRIRPRLQAVLSVMCGYVDWVTEQVCQRLLPNGSRIAEAFRRQQASPDPAHTLVSGLFGVDVSRQVLDSGHAFVRTVAERGGQEALSLLTSDISAVPTPAELDSPGLWMARMQIDQELPELDPETLRQIDAIDDEFPDA